MIKDLDLKEYKNSKILNEEKKIIVNKSLSIMEEIPKINSLLCYNNELYKTYLHKNHKIYFSYYHSINKNHFGILSSSIVCDKRRDNETEYNFHQPLFFGHKNNTFIIKSFDFYLEIVQKEDKDYTTNELKWYKH